MNHEPDDAPDNCPVCIEPLRDDGDCATCGCESDWRKRAEEARAERIRDMYANEDDDA